jgi:hypothetical protein
MAVQIFAMHTFATEAGLPVQETFSDDLSEVAREGMDWVVREVGRAINERRDV